MQDPQPPDETATPAPDQTPATPKTRAHIRHWRRFKDWSGSHKKRSVVATFIVILLIIAGVPWSRYHAAGLVLKKDFTVQVSDSVANTPVSGATVSLGGVSGVTNGSGKVTLKHIKVGKYSLLISKKYYQQRRVVLTVPILNQKTPPDVSFVATGRQALIKITNLINGKVLADAQINVAGTSAKTADDGTATVVLPVDASSQKATLSLDGYNDSSVTVQVSNQKIKENDFKLTPVGKLYFLSTINGPIDLMKANLDGTGTSTVVPASGYEISGSTIVSESPDGNYVALISRRSASDITPQLYVLATADDQLIKADYGDADFTIYGWAGDNLIYSVSRDDINLSQSGKYKLKSYDATSGKNTLLDQDSAMGDSNSAYVYYESYASIYLSGNSVLFTKNWNGSFNGYTNQTYTATIGKDNTVQVIDADGQNHQTVYSAATGSVNGTSNYYSSLSTVQHGSDSFYIDESDTQFVGSLSTSDNYYDYSLGGKTKQSNITSTGFYGAAYTYFSSPSANQSLWTEFHDGKNSLLLANSDGSGSKTIQSLSDYTAQGWYTDNYLLLNKANSELYISDLKAGNPIKVADFEPGTFAL